MPDEPKNVFISSTNQSGGITAHTINFGPRARSMSAALGDQLKHMVPSGAKVQVISVLGDGEAFAFANQVLAWLRANEYTDVTGVDQGVFMEPVMGQNVKKISDSEFQLIIGRQ